MSLNADTLYAQIRTFADPSATPFAYAMTEDEARWAWAEAFTAYAKAIEPTTPPPPTLPTIAKAFHDTLRLAPAVTAMPPASDFAAAWSAAMLAVAPWDDPTFATRLSALRTTLADLFAASSFSDQLRAIATAFHAATAGITLAGVSNG
jgi:hypothetical protein